MRAKYKLGQFIKTTETEELRSVSGVIDAVVLRNSGVTYGISGQEEEVEESEVAAVYRAVLPRQPKASNGKAKAKTKKTELKSA